MAVNLTVNGVAYSFPETGDASWGTNVTNWATAVTSGMLQKAGGTFTLTADANFGATFGLLSAYFTSVTANPASAGAVRLAKSDSIKFRNNANSADVAVALDGSDNLTFGGTKVTISGAIVNADIAAGAAIAYSKLALTGAILNADLAGSIAYSKLSLTGAILNADLAGSIAYSKLSLTGAVVDGDLATSYVKANGTRPLTGNWALGGFALSGLTNLTSNTANTASAGTFRLANADTVSWRNNANGGNLLLQPDSGDLLTFNGNQITINGGTQTLTGKTMSGSSNTFSNIADGSLSTAYVKADGTRNITANQSIVVSANTGAGIILQSTDTGGKSFKLTSTGSGDGDGAGLIKIYNLTDNFNIRLQVAASDIVVNRDTTDTLTNKTLKAPLLTSAVAGYGKIAGAGVAQSIANSGTGTYVLQSTANSCGVFLIQESNNGHMALAVVTFSNVVNIIYQDGTVFATANGAAKLGLTFVSSTGTLSVNNQTGSTDTVVITGMMNQV